MALRIVVLGAGHWHGAFDAAYLRLFARMPAVEVVGVHDDKPAVAADRARIVGATAYTDARQMIETEQPDFALSLGTHATMPALHRLCLDYRLPFMTEKPMGRHADEVRPVVERIEREGLYVAVALPNRLGSIYARAKAMLAEGAFGTPVYLHFRIIRPTLNRYPQYDSPWMLDPAISGGGCLRNLGPHPFDVFLSLTGEAAEVTAATISFRGHDAAIEDYAAVTLRSASGIVGTLETGYTYPTEGTDMELRIAGSEAILRFDRAGAIIARATGEEELATSAEALAGYDALLSETIERFRRGDPPIATPRDCLRAVELIDAAYRLAGAPWA
jgi:predicted dehydrogenase